MRCGDRVHHPQLGEGEIVEIVPRGTLRGARVDFGYLVTWCSAVDLGITLYEPDEAPEKPPAGDTAAADMVDARRGVLALKLGQVLEEHVFGLSSGLDEERERLETAVAAALRREPQCVLVRGPWGSGKTHLLTMLDAIASKEGMATSSVILDGEATCLWEPMSLMEAMLGSLRYPDEPAPCGLGHRLSRLKRSGEWGFLSRRRGERLARAVQEIPAAAFDDPDAIQHFEDYLMLSLSASQAKQKLAQLGYRRVKLPSMKERSVAGRAGRFDELLAGWAEFVTLTGAKGLLLVIDEVDVEYASTLREPDRRRRRAWLLRALRAHLRSKRPLVIAFGSAPSDSDDPQNDAVEDLRKQLRRLVDIEAPRPRRSDLLTLGERLTSLYARAYPEDDSPSVGLSEFADQHLESLQPIPRDFVRGVLERLDLAACGAAR